MNLRLGLIGVGSHCKREHLPALAGYQLLHPDRLTLQAVCDLNQQAAEAVASEYGFRRVYSDLDTMLRTEQLDAVIAVTPIQATAMVSCRIMETGNPLLMEKPLGITIEEAQRVVATAERTSCPVMVGMNRRFDPVIRAMADWLTPFDPEWVSIRLHRKGRTETGFVRDVILHPLDTMVSLLGNVRVLEVAPIGRNMGEAFIARIEFGGRVKGVLECLPDCGHWLECYNVSGKGFHAEGNSLRSFQGRADGQEPTEFTRPAGIQGQATFHETCAFLDGVVAGRLPEPQPYAVLNSMLAVEQIAQAVCPARDNTDHDWHR